MTGTAPAGPAGVRGVALAGNPNCGKTTLFNALTGLRHRVGNYAGVTVERREGKLTGGNVNLLDLPGTYSLNARSPDEEIARDVILGRHDPKPELILVVVDATNLERNLYLYTQVADLGLPVIVCLNMMDVADQLGLRVDAVALSEALGVPVAPLVASKGVGIPALRELLSNAPLPAPPVRHWELASPMEADVSALADLLIGRKLVEARAAFFSALSLLSQPGVPGFAAAIADPEVAAFLPAALERLRTAGVDPEAEPVEARYAWIGQVCAAATHQGEIPVTWTDRVDRIATHKIGGFVVFFLLMALMFQAIFTWAQAPMGWIETLLTAAGDAVGPLLPEGELRSLVVDGVLAGVGGVLVFLPQIVFLFLFIGVLEDSGYMARAAFVMDRVMSRVGLHGKSFIPLLSSFACAIPGILATRTIENRQDRMVTILVAPLMSCSARLPVYTVLIAGFIPATRLGGVVSLPALVMVSMYLLGLVAALGMAALFKRTLFRGEAPLFLMELPPYKLPAPKTVLLQTWERSSEFVQRAGTVILAISIILWFTMRFPGDSRQPSSERLRNSIAGHAGRWLEPLIQPFGMDWKVGIGILGSFAAREVFVSTMATVYAVDDTDEEKQSISVRQQMQAERDPGTGQPRFTALSAVALMVFYVLAMQCVSTIATVRRETQSWKWPLFQWVYMCALAWVAATVVYQGGRFLGFP